MFRCFKKPVSVEKAIKEMRQVEAVLQDMIHKYERIKTETKVKFKDETTKRRKLMHLKRIKTLEHHITQCGAKLIACVNKQYALEQLEITKMQIEAIKSSTSIFKSRHNSNSSSHHHDGNSSNNINKFRLRQLITCCDCVP